LTTKELAFATDYCGVRSGREVDKWQEMKLTKLPSTEVAPPSIAESPVNIECRVRSVERLGSHDMFIADVVAVRVDDKYMDEKGSFHLSNANPIVYSHGEYYDMGEKIGKFGYSVQKK
jgi:flavin reductase (DIM6/NTAB) family NADH-FMN oxidoreductase RutF